MSLRDHFKCQYCYVDVDMDSSTIDHIIPKSAGGKTTWENVVTSCKTCNSNKGCRMDIKPKQMPVEPNYYQMAALRRHFPFKARHSSWEDYLPNCVS
jgi:5-methylcytosine-specific restriction endonuclease McrA